MAVEKNKRTQIITSDIDEIHAIAPAERIGQVEKGTCDMTKRTLKKE